MIVDLRNSRNKPKFKHVHVETFAEASKVVSLYITLHDLTAGCGSGGNDFTCGKVYDDGKKVGHVSYNGRVWDNDGKEIVS